MSTTTERRRIARESSDAPPSGWWNVARRVKDDVAADNVSMIAAGAAFFGLLALFPALAAAVALYGLVTDPSTVSAHLDLLSGFVPAEARMILDEQLQRITASANTSLGIGAVVALLVATWSAAKGVKSLMTALDVVYHEREDRGFFKLNGTALLLTIAMLVVVPLSLAVVAVLPALIDRLPLPDLVATAARWLRWPLIAAVSVAAMTMLYRLGPAHTEGPKPSLPGAIAATILWLIASALFSWYVSTFGSYNETYGSVAAMAVIMMWFWLSAFAVLIGGEINAELAAAAARAPSPPRRDVSDRRPARR
ncbi:MAG TPA: YihY/virulence factor BrkB family protein [Gammaproteobacteria bacterium]|nr:YihY/virulence factor BrkB family protein [Gammaproteobacteria bacterium]